MPKSKPPRKRRARSTMRESVERYVRTRNRRGLELFIVASAAGGQIGVEDRDHVERLVREAVEAASPETREWWLRETCPCGEPIGHPVDPDRLYKNDAGRFVHHDALMTAQGGHEVEARGLDG